MKHLKKLFESFDNRGMVSLNRFMEIIFEIHYEVLEFDFTKISYDDTCNYDSPEQAPKKYTESVAVTHETYLGYTDVEIEMKCRVLEWLSRPAFKEGNPRTRRWYLDGINKYLGTSFNRNDIDQVYCRLGNKVNRKLCIDFIESGYDMKKLERESNA